MVEIPNKRFKTCRYHGSHIQRLTYRRPSAEAAAFEFGFLALPRVRGNAGQTRYPFVRQPPQFGQHRHQRSRRYRTDAFDLLRHLGFAVKMRVGVVVDLFVQFVNQPVKMGNQLFDASDLRFMNLMQTVFLGSPHIRRLVAAVNQGFQHFFRFCGRLVGHGLPIFFLRHHLCEEGEHFGIFGVGFGQRLRLGKLMRLTRVGDNHGYACSADGFGGGDFETASTFRHDEGDLVFFKVFDSMGDTFGVVGFGFGFRQRRNGDDEVSFGDVDIVN